MGVSVVDGDEELRSSRKVYGSTAVGYASEGGESGTSLWWCSPRK